MVKCPNCGKKALKTSRNEFSLKYAETYVQCTNTEHCGGGFVISQAFKHWTNPPQQTTKQLAAALIKTLPREEQLELLSLN